MATTKIKKSNTALDTYINLGIKHAPILAPSFVAVIFIGFILWPAFAKFSSLSRDIKEKDNFIITATRSNADVANMKKDLEIFRVKAAEFENKLPHRMKTTLIIETLQEITKKAKLKFSSLEPVPIKKYILSETKDVFVELPVKVKLSCGYYDLIDFLRKIETAGQLMKITDLSVRDDSASNWEHNIELSISAFSKGDGSE